MESTYEIEVRVRCKVAAADKAEADEAAQQFAQIVGGWINGSSGHSPFDHYVDMAEASAKRRSGELDLNYFVLTPAKIRKLHEEL